LNKYLGENNRILITGYSITSINMKTGDESTDTDETLRYFAGCPRCGWTGKVFIYLFKFTSRLEAHEIQW